MPSDQFAIRAVVATACLIAAGSVLAVVALSLTHTTVPPSLDDIMKMSITGLLGLLVRTGSSDPVQAQIVNDEEDPVVTEDVKKK